ncbi:hypothetical protein A9Q78_06240 [Methylophaga sp. 41_12_T18]|nr:hypothetical protein A9Q78_06240 [Methylophaga sp. 41_12_T18]
MKLTLKLLLLLLLPLTAMSQTWHAQSGERQLAVLELFTAEGCGLCPAADRWVEHLPEQGINEDHLIVLGFHIDYLNDQKAWVDRFASPVFSDRQSQLAQINLYKTIYTPEFVVSGEVVHNYQKHVKKVIHAVNGFEPEAKITMNVSEQDDSLNINGQVLVQGVDNQQFSKLYIALIEDDIKSKVSGGDNVGKTFNHQNLVRTWLGPFDIDEAGRADVSTSIAMLEEWQRHKMSVVAIVQNLEDGFVLQGLSIPLIEKEK